MTDRSRTEQNITPDTLQPLHGTPNPPENGVEAAKAPANRNAALAATLASSPSSDLVTEVHISADPHSVLPPSHPAISILANSSLVIQRQMEMMNLLIGFEQANRYIIMDGNGQTIGYIAEQDHGIGQSFMRQIARTHRSFTTHIFDRWEREVLRIHRPFAYINSRIRIYDCVPEGGYEAVEESASTALQTPGEPSPAPRTSPLKLEEMRIIGEAQQQWAPLRRKYNLFTYRDESLKSETTDSEPAIEAGMSQFAHVNEPFLSWDFTLRSDSNAPVGSVSRDFAGFAREIFTDTGVYALRMDSAAQSSSLESADGKEVAQYERDATAMTLDQRAVMLATAVSIDFDYFSRHSSQGGGMGMMPFMIPMGGGAAEGGAAAGGAAAGGAAAGAEGAAGAGALEGAAGAAGRGVAGGEGAMAGVGTMAGYEAMQRGAGQQTQQQPVDDASPTAGNDPFDAGQGGQGSAQGGDGDLWGESSDPWGESQDPWSGQGGGNAPPPSGGGDAGGGEGGGGWLDSISDFFGD